MLLGEVVHLRKVRFRISRVQFLAQLEAEAHSIETKIS